MKAGAWMKRNWWRFAVSLFWDVLVDNTIGRIPVIGEVIDFIGGIIGVALWGPVGLLEFGELLDITDQFDGFFPSLTISGFIRLYTETR